MPEVTIQGRKVPANEDQSLLDVLIGANVQVKKLCGGRGLCATCHVYVRSGSEGLSAPTNREEMTLSILTGAQENSRLACQCKVQGGGVDLELPDGLYVESFQDLETQVGKRTSVPILHPRTGQVLVEANKIIIRTQIMKLKDMDFSVLVEQE
ncbi:2Fe-2S iron-sulfur cluster-binding protein [Wenzhouxiangella sp. XN79A]|uniref:2Fe-2S iron-sulfur cluster-binding protein n=1 Tax=Wenzhouxiangella sp. XN79A TaxID=2724193 RepID=UPI00197D4743|nr:2Fe-2S iron-sulfur cluster-binding protein [Wenzhouxiangella sp. XN79A]